MKSTSTEKIRIIPAIDIMDGKCVRLTKGDYDAPKVYYENPVEVAKLFEDHGVRFLHVVDLDGAKSSRIVNHKILEKIATETTLQVDFGGGIKSDEDIRIAFESGAAQITGGSIAVKNQELFLSWLERYGSDKIILGADCKERKIATNGWLESSEVDVVSFIEQYKKYGIKYVICTDIAKDGMLEGPSFDLYEEILEEIGVKLIASGGVAHVEDINRLQDMGCEAVILGKAIYENRITLKQLSELC